MDTKTEYLKLPIIIDIGSGEVKAGISGQEAPKTIFPNYIGEPKYRKVLRTFSKENQELRESYTGSDCEKYMGVLKLRYPVKNGVFENDQDILTLFNYIYSKLEINSEEIREHPVLITEPLLNPYSNRENIATALFENLSVPALFFASQPILSLFSTSNTSGVVLESGDGVSQCCVVYEGYSIPNSYLRFDFGGRDVTEYLQTLLRRQGYSFNTTAEFQIVKKIKEQLCYMVITNFDGNKKAETGETNYILPDGNSIKIRDEKVLAPEILFKPYLIGYEYLGFQEMISNALNKVDLDLRSKLYSSIMLSGGNTLWKGIPEKTHTEIKKFAPKHMKIKLHVPNNRQYACWIGGNVISTLEIFKKMWVSKNDWSEKGKSIIHMKSI
jgi:centractin